MSREKSNVVTKFVIMADRKSNVDGEKTENEKTDKIQQDIWGNIPKQLRKVNGESLLERTVRLLKERGITDITITSHDERYEVKGAKRYEPKANKYWVDAYTEELIVKPIVFLHGDVYYSEKAIDTIINTETDSVVFFGSNVNKSKSKAYFKNWDEPFGVKIVDTKLFKQKRKEIRELALKEDWARCISWELYRYMNNIPLHTHMIKENGGYVSIIDETTDIDCPEDLERLEKVVNDYFTNKIATVEVTFDFKDTIEVEDRKVGDQFKVTECRLKELLGNNLQKLKVVKLIRIDKKKEN